MRHIRFIREGRAIPRIIFSDDVHSGNPERKARVAADRRRVPGPDPARSSARDSNKARIRRELDPDSRGHDVLRASIVPAGILWHLTDGGFDVTRHAARAWQMFQHGHRATSRCEQAFTKERHDGHPSTQATDRCWPLLVALAVTALVLTCTRRCRLLRLVGLSSRPNAPRTIRVSGNIEITDAEVSFKIPGRVEQRLFDEGQWSRRARSSPCWTRPTCAATCDCAAADVALAQAALDEVEPARGPRRSPPPRPPWTRPSTCGRSQGRLARRRRSPRPRRPSAPPRPTRTGCETELARAARLLERSSIPAEDYDRAKAASRRGRRAASPGRRATFTWPRRARARSRSMQAEAAYRQAAEQYELVEDGPRKEDIDQAGGRGCNRPRRR